jgi:predicted  nucleic acid-binding Zn-ribbon protein
MAQKQQLVGHAEFKELAAAAMLNDLTISERLRLQEHLDSCDDCREVYREYLVVAGDVMPMLASRQDDPENQENWNEGPWREGLLRRIQKDKQTVPAVRGFIPGLSSVRRMTTSEALLGVAACGACFILGGAILGHQWAGRRTTSQQTTLVHSQVEISARDEIKNSGSDVGQSALDLGRSLAQEKLRSETFEADLIRRERELTKMRSDWKDLSDRENQLVSSSTGSDVEIKNLTDQRDALKDQIAKTEQSFAKTQNELSALRNERDDALTKIAALQSKVDELSININSQEHQIAEDEQYLNSDRDIRELMGARQLYIADVFDVDSHSRTRPPFGRIFYTHGKSLIFYAFDLDNQKGVVNASTFQVWGKGTDAQTPLSLGILYLDNETNRRWLLRSDDAQQLAKIDSVFVTVEPKGGSRKPTGKPFLYALLRKEANHP